MLISNFTARSGLIAQQQRLDVIGNNMANISTAGYKSVRADFADMLYTTMVRPAESEEELNLERGHGVLLSATTRSFQQGASQLSGLPLDFMLSGEGFFTVQDAAGNTRYTRDGSFAISKEDDGNFLVTQTGNYVLNTNGERINLQNANDSKVEVDQDGRIFIQVYTEATETAPASTERVAVGQLGIAKFMNKKGLDAVSGNLFAQTDVSGEAEADADTKVQQGMLEMSNVDLAVVMTRMIRAQRAFSLAARALTTADEMDQKSIQIRS